MADAPKQTSFV